VGELYFAKSCEAPELSDEVRSYLSPNNAYLDSLRHQYRQVTPPFLHSVWNSEYVEAEVPFDRFRGDCAFVWQKRDLNTPATYILTALYFQTLGLEHLLKALGEDGAFGAHTIPFADMMISRDLLDSVSEIEFLDRTIGIRSISNLNIIDIGSGYGRLAHRMVCALPSIGTVCCFDVVPESTFLCDFYIGYRNIRDNARVVTLPDTRSTLAKTTPFLATNIHSFSECSVASIRWWIEILAESKVRYLFVVTNGDVNGGKALMRSEEDGSRIDYFTVLRENGYRMLTCEAKYALQEVQLLGVSPTWYYLFEAS